ncbi:hypothetical protein [Marinivivus vitaminiproducens]|uniref:hypothetical protein n=1 Tax=Marinivivus vitaminiproducens TaxID=3035935 RepID=UPI00279E3235|nr:hypothetical protein P4R82_17815 [Geminicoccaceae bacterium SCSIO 64248]
MRAASGGEPPASGRLDAVFWLLAVLFALWFAHHHVFATERNGNADLPGLIDGTADPPYRYRFLMPLLLRGMHDAAAAAGLPVETETLAFAADAVSALALVAAFAGLVGRYVASRPFARLAGLSLMLPLVWHFVAPDRLNPYYPWDIPQILAFALGLRCLAIDRLAGFHAVFVAATFNRETSIVLTLLLVTGWAGRRPWRSLIGHAALQAAAWLAIRAGAILWLGGQRGVTSLEPGIGDIPQNDLFWATGWLNLDHFVREPWDLIELASIFVFGLIPLALFATRVPCAMVRRMLLVVPAFLAMTWLVGLVLEFRIYGEMIPLVWLALVLLAAKSLGLPFRDHGNASGEPAGRLRATVFSPILGVNPEVLQRAQRGLAPPRSP